jgi:hypothetical protein
VLATLPGLAEAGHVGAALTQSGFAAVGRVIQVWWDGAQRSARKPDFCANNRPLSRRRHAPPRHDAAAATPPRHALPPRPLLPRLPSARLSDLCAALRRLAAAGEGAWFLGRIAAFNPLWPAFLVLYDDGDWQWESLHALAVAAPLNGAARQLPTLRPAAAAKLRAAAAAGHSGARLSLLGAEGACS